MNKPELRRSQLGTFQDLYDKHLFIQAFHHSAASWQAVTDLRTLSADELIFASRLSARLGGWRLSRWLIMRAAERDPGNGWVQFSRIFAKSPKRRIFDELRAFEKSPELTCEDPSIRAHWRAAWGVIWAQFRDFERAHACLKAAESSSEKQAWVLCCQSDVLLLEDRRIEALEAAENAWSLSPGAPAAMRSLTNSLLSLGRFDECAARSRKAAVDGESQEIALAAAQNQCVLAESLDGAERNAALENAKLLMDRAVELAPLADRESKALQARIRIEIASLLDDREGIKKWAEAAKLPFYRKILANLERNPTGGRFRLPHRRIRQKYQECLPTSIASVLSALGVNLDPQEMASTLTFGGTQPWRAFQWLEERGLHVRPFAVNGELATALIKAGIPFVLGLESDDFSHAVAAVGMDEAAGTLIINDPASYRSWEYLLSDIGLREFPIGPRALAVVPPDRLPELDALLPLELSETVAAIFAHQRAMSEQGIDAARAVVRNLREKYPAHETTRFLSALQSAAEGRALEALRELKALTSEFPSSSLVRQCLLSACQRLGNTAMFREALAEVVEAGILPGVQTQQEWRHPPARYVCQLADHLLAAAETRADARRLLSAVLKRQPTSAEAWQVYGNLLGHERDLNGRVLAFRMASRLAVENEHAARSYCDALATVGRKQDGLDWLEARARRYGEKASGASAWISWIAALERWGEPQKAIDACDEALRLRGESSELKAFAASLFARLGDWERSNECLSTLQSAGNQPAYFDAATQVARMRGELKQAIAICTKWIEQSPHALNARSVLLDLANKREGVLSAQKLARKWWSENPGHDDIERLYLGQLDFGTVSRWKKDLVLARRVRRNPQDAWAWRELAIRRIGDVDRVSGPVRQRSQRSAAEALENSDRTAPEDGATLRAHALWCEANQQWSSAGTYWIRSIQREPDNAFGYRKLWNCSVALPEAERTAALQQLEAALESCPTRVPFVRDLGFLFAQRLGVSGAEAILRRVAASRADDPEIIHALADLFLQSGRSRSDAQRALEIVEPASIAFPYHLGLRFSLANAYQRLGMLTQAEAALREIVRRFPANVPAHLQLAHLLDRTGRKNEVGALMNAVAERAPLSPDIWAARVQIFARNNQYAQARAVVAQGVQLLPDGVDWREKAVSLLMECGDAEGAVQVAREGVTVYPRGAYLWLVLAEALKRVPAMAQPGEIEKCLRTSLSLNRSLARSADLLAVTLAEQRRFQEAEDVLQPLVSLFSDSSAVRGRLAWIKRQRGEKQEARTAMQDIIRDVPWYRWGWLTLMSWIVEDKAWSVGKEILLPLPPAFRGDTAIRKQHLSALQKCGVTDTDLDAEWDALLADFPDDVSIHLQRYDILCRELKPETAAAVLRRISTAEPNNPSVQARMVEVLLREGKRDAALELALNLCFREVEDSAWPVGFSWKAAREAGAGEDLYKRVLAEILKGNKPTPQAMASVAAHGLGPVKRQKRRLQPRWRSWFDSGVRQTVQVLLNSLNPASPRDAKLVAAIFAELTARGYYREVFRYWKSHEAALSPHVRLWAEAGGAILGLGWRRKARKHFSEWQTRPGAPMSTVTNYVLSSPHASREARIALRDACDRALSILPHDHSAKYLAHVLAESQAMLGDQPGFLTTMQTYKDLFCERLNADEFFVESQKYLLKELPRIGSLLKQQNPAAFSRRASRLWFRQIPWICLATVNLD